MEIAGIRRYVRYRKPPGGYLRGRLSRAIFQKYARSYSSSGRPLQDMCIEKIWLFYERFFVPVGVVDSDREELRNPQVCINLTL